MERRATIQDRLRAAGAYGSAEARTSTVVVIDPLQVPWLECLRASRPNGPTSLHCRLLRKRESFLMVEHAAALVVGILGFFLLAALLAYVRLSRRLRALALAVHRF